MKTNYTAPKMEIKEFERENVLTASGNTAVEQAKAYFNGEYSTTHQEELKSIVTLG